MRTSMPATLRRPQYECALTAVTWNRDSHGLFDYESSSVKQMISQTVSNSYLVRSQLGDVLLVSEKDYTLYTLTPYTSLIRIMPCPNSFESSFAVQDVSKKDVYQDPLSKPWIVLSSLCEGGISRKRRLVRGDIVKFGRVQMKVKDFRIADAKSNMERVSLMHESGPVDLLDGNARPTGAEDACRYCYISESTKENPLLSACKCTGSMQFIHFNCIKNWMNVKLQKVENPHYISYSWKTFECELCKTEYPFKLKIEGRIYHVFDLPIPPSSDYIILETVNKCKHVGRAMHLLLPTAEKSSFKIGRGHESEIRISDISVSRVHALLTYGKEGFVIEDNSSKFGTLVLGPPSLYLEPRKLQLLQVGRTLIKLQVRASRYEPDILADEDAISRKTQSPSTLLGPGPDMHAKAHKAKQNQGDSASVDDIPEDLFQLT